MRILFVSMILFVGGATHTGNAQSEDLDRAAATAALKQAVRFYRQDVATHGGYLWRYSADLTTGEGEESASRTTAWVQPPGTPTVGEAYLTAFHLTKEASYLAAAVETAEGLANGQLESGGWDYRIEFQANRERYRYRLDNDRPKARNVTTLDDNVTQSALQFLMHVDRATEYRNQTIHDAAVYAMKRLEQAQYPNGAWAQRFSQPPVAAAFPVLDASYPESWPRTYPKVDYRSFYTFNDNTMADMIVTFFHAASIYESPHYQAVAEKAGDFLLSAQMPEPQPAWAQQYDAKMQPAWARRFEPAAITGGESQGVLRTLLKLYEWTGKEKYLKPIPRALAYLKSSELDDGRLARFYELRTNRPLYFTTKYELTYNDDDLPTHYGFKVSSSLDSIQATYDRLKSAAPRPLKVVPPRPGKLTARLIQQTRDVVDTLDERGAWVEQGSLKTANGKTDRIIDSRTFAKNVTTLAQFIAARR